MLLVNVKIFKTFKFGGGGEMISLRNENTGPGQHSGCTGFYFNLQFYPMTHNFNFFLDRYGFNVKDEVLVPRFNRQVIYKKPPSVF